VARDVPCVEIAGMGTRISAVAVSTAVLALMLTACASPPSSSRSVTAAFARAPMAFEPNVGQAPGDVRYVSEGGGYRLWLSPGEARFVAPRGDGAVGEMRLRWPGGATAPAMFAEDERPVRARGDERGRPTYARVVYRAVYPGVDLVFHGSPHDAEFDFVVAPGADPRVIELELAGADRVSMHGDDLVAARGAARLRLHTPVVYQETAGGRVPVAGRFRLEGRRVTFDVGPYDRSRALVIDPVVTYATYYGGTESEGGQGIGVDAAGNIYAIVGRAIVKLSADGATRLYSVTLGDATPNQLAVDPAGNAYVLSSCPFPRSGATFDCPGAGAGRPQAQGDSMTLVTKLGPGGDIVHATSTGGVGTVTGTGIAVDRAGNVYVTGYNTYGGFPITRPAFARPGVTDGFPAFVEAFAADLSRFIYVVEFLTGGDFVRPSAIAVDRTGAVYLTGTAGQQFPATAGAFQPTTNGATGAAFVAKIAPDGSDLVYGTYFGNASHSPSAVAVDGDGNAYIAGQAGPGLPTVNALQPAFGGGSTDAFVARLNPAGSGLVFSTYLGGTGDEAAAGLGLDSSANVYLAGQTRSIDFPQQNPLASRFGSAGGNFVAELVSDGGVLVYATYFADPLTTVASLAVTATGTVFLTGATGSSAFPTVHPFQAFLGGNTDGFVARLEPSEPRVFITSPVSGVAVAGTVWTDVWVENFVGTSNAFTLSVGGRVVATGTATNHATLPWDSRGVADGPQTLTATVRDSAGHVGATTRRLTVHNGTMPTLAALFTSPTASTVSGTVTVGLSESGASGPPITFTLTIDGGQVFTVAGNGTAASFTWDTTRLTDGAHTLGLTVRDGAGRTATATRSMTVANGGVGGGKLAVAITSPAVGATVGGTVWSDIWVDNAATGARSFTLSVGTTTLVTITDSGNHVTLPWDSTKVPNGSQALTATVRDAANAAGTATRVVNVQNAGGGTFSVFITAPASGATVHGTGWFTIWIEGAAAGAKTYTLSVGGATISSTSTASNGPVSLAWPTSAPDNGARTATVTVRDGANATGRASVVVTVAD
jgi:hypothetical protein